MPQSPLTDYDLDGAVLGRITTFAALQTAIDSDWRPGAALHFRPDQTVVIMTEAALDELVDEIKHRFNIEPEEAR